MFATSKAPVLSRSSGLRAGNRSIEKADPRFPGISAGDRAVSDFLKGLTDEDCEMLVSLGRIVQCRAGESVIRAGEPGGELYLVLVGALTQESGSSRKSSEASAIFLRGDVVGEVPFLTSGIRRASVLALEESRLLALPYLAIDKLVTTEPRLATKVFRNLGRVVAHRFQHEIGFTVTQVIPPSAPVLSALTSCA